MKTVNFNEFTMGCQESSLMEARNGRFLSLNKGRVKIQAF